MLKKMKVNKMCTLKNNQQKDYFEKYASVNPYFHHIHVRFGDQVFTLSHDTGFITADQLYAALNDLRDQMDLYD